MPERRAFYRNALTSYGQRALLGLSALLLTPYLFRSLGIDGFGTWSVIFTLTTVFTMLEVGFSAGTTKFVAEHRATGQRRELEQTIGAAVTLMAAFGVIALAVCALIGLFASGLAAEDDREAFEVGMLILGGAFLIRLPLVAYGAVLTGYQRYDLYNLGQAVLIAGTALGAVVALELGGGVLGVTISYAVALVAGGVTYVALALRTAGEVRLRPGRSGRAARRRVLGFSSFTLLADSMMFVGARLDTVVIAAIRNAAAAAPFAAASKLQNGLQALTLPVINMMLPMVSDLDARGLRAVIVRRLVAATRVTLQVTIPVALVVALFSTDIVDLWLGAGAPGNTAGIVSVMAIQTVMLSAVPADKVLIGIGRARTIGVLNTAEGLFNLGISVVLVSAYGAIGAAIGTLISSFLVGPTKFPLVARATGCRLARLVREGLLPAIAWSLPSAATMLPVWLLLSPSAGRLALGAALGLGVAGLVAILQLGPGRIRSELRAGLGKVQPEPDSPTSQVVVQGPS